MFLFCNPACLRKYFHRRALSIWVFSSDENENVPDENPVSDSCAEMTPDDDMPVGPLRDPVTWYGINYAETQVTQWDFQSKGTCTSPARLSFVLKLAFQHNLFRTMCDVTGSCKGPISDVFSHLANNGMQFTRVLCMSGFHDGPKLVKNLSSLSTFQSMGLQRAKRFSKPSIRGHRHR